MANEFKHKDPGTELTQAEFIAACGDGHIFACQATGDIVYASSATVLSKLARGAANTVLSMGGSCVPAWTASPSVTDLTISGGCITLTGAATDIDLIDNNACALSFDASGQAGILAIDTQNCAEGVKMSGKLTVTGAISTTGALTVGACDTGLDVKFFGASAGAYVLYDQSEDQLEIRGASADATTSTGKLLLSTSLTNVNANDVIGSINFQAPAEAGGTDAVAIAAGIRAVAQATFTCAVNSTDLIFYTGHSEAATEKFRFTSQGEIGIGGANYGTDGQVLTSGGAGAAPAWEDAAGGAGGACAVQVNDCVAVALGTGSDSKLYYDGTDTHLDLLVVGSGDFVIAQAACHPSPDPGQVHLWAGSAGCVTATTTSQLTIEDNTNTGISILTPAACFGAVYFGSPGSGCEITGGLIYNHGACRFCVRVEKNNVHAMTATSIQAASGCASTPGFAFKSDVDTGSFLVSAGNIGWAISGSERMRLNSNGGLFVNETADGTTGAGALVSNSGAADDPHFILKSTDVGHSMTGLAEADTYFTIQKGHATEGQATLQGYSGGVQGLRFAANSHSPESGDTCGSKGAMYFQAYKRNGTSNAALAACENAFTFAGGAVHATFLIKGNGDLHGADTSISSLDTHCDVGLIRAIETTKRTEGIIKSKWDDHVHENIDSLIDAGLYSVPPWEGGLLNLSQLWRLHNGAIWQLWTTIKDQGEEILGLRQQLTALEGK